MVPHRCRQEARVDSGDSGCFASGWPPSLNRAMNHCVLEVEVIDAPTVRYTQDNQTPIAEMAVRSIRCVPMIPRANSRSWAGAAWLRIFRTECRWGSASCWSAEDEHRPQTGRHEGETGGCPARLHPSEVRQQARLQSRRPQAVSRLPPPSEPNSRTRRRRAGIPLPWCRTPTRSPSDLTDRRSPPAIHWRG